MPLILELPGELEVELVTHWQQAGLIEGDAPMPVEHSTGGERAEHSSQFRLPDALQTRLHDLLDRQDSGEPLSGTERREAESLVEMADFLSLLHLRSLSITPS